MLGWATDLGTPCLGRNLGIRSPGVGGAEKRPCGRIPDVGLREGSELNAKRGDDGEEQGLEGSGAPAPPGHCLPAPTAMLLNVRQRPCPGSRSHSCQP